MAIIVRSTETCDHPMVVDGLSCSGGTGQPALAVVPSIPLVLLWLSLAVTKLEDTG